MPVVPDILAHWGIRQPFSALSHLAGALVSLVALYVLLRKAHRQGLDRAAFVELVVYALSLVLVLTASGLYHLFSGPPERLARFNRLDHAAIFLLIAATATVVYGTLHRRWAEGLIALIWSVSLASLAVHMTHWPPSPLLSTSLYLLAGWTPALGVVGLIHALGLRRMGLFLGGGLMHTLGAVMFALKWPVLWPGVIEGHEVFHVMVLLGMGMHYVFIYRCCLPADRPDVLRHRHRVSAPRLDRGPRPCLPDAPGAGKTVT